MQYLPWPQSHLRPPSLFTLNGFGLSLAGSRDKDPQTGASIKSHVITLLFIPVFVLGSYVTAPAPDGGYHFSRRSREEHLCQILEYLSRPRSRRDNRIEPLECKFNSPGAIAKKELAVAKTELESGEPIVAANLYLTQLWPNLPKKEEALSGLKEALRKAMDSERPSESMDAIELALESPELGEVDESFQINLANSAMKRLDEYGESYRKNTVLLIEEIQQIQESDLDPDLLESKRRITLINLMRDQSEQP